MVRIPPPIWMFLLFGLGWAASVFGPGKSAGEFRIVPLGIALVVIGVALGLARSACSAAKAPKSGRIRKATRSS